MSEVIGQYCRETVYLDISTCQTFPLHRLRGTMDILYCCNVRANVCIEAGDKYKHSSDSGRGTSGGRWRLLCKRPRNVPALRTEA